MASNRFRSRSPRRKADVPWFNPLTAAIPNFQTRLNAEIVECCDYLQPKSRDAALHRELLEHLEHRIRLLWPCARLTVFGSVETGLWVPGSDLDLTILLSLPISPISALHKLANSLQNSHFIIKIHRITHAKVPIIKLHIRNSNLIVDISINQSNGVRGVEIVKEYIEKYPEIRYLIPILKYFLKKKGLNETYSGGIGSFLLFCMVVSTVQMGMDRDLGGYLMVFLERFGEKFDYLRDGISIKGLGKVFRKGQKGWVYGENRELLAVESPVDEEVDIGRNAYRIREVRQTLRWALRRVQAQGLSGLFEL